MDFWVALKKTFRVYRVRIFGDTVQLSDRLIIWKTLVLFTDEMLIPKLEICLTNDTRHLGKTWDGRQAVGHHCLRTCKYRLCALLKGICRATIVHEATHAYHSFLDASGSSFSQKWLKVAGNVYNKDATAPNKDGILDAYARLHHEEDIARWVEYCYLYLYEEKKTDHFSGLQDRKSDPRYRQKLALLHQYKFLSDEQYVQFKPLFDPAPFQENK